MIIKFKEHERLYYRVDTDNDNIEILGINGENKGLVSKKHMLCHLLDWCLMLKEFPWEEK